MRTTISLDQELMDELMEQENFKSRSEAIRKAIEVFLQERRKERFKRLAGSNLIDLSWQSLEEIELEELNAGD